MADKRQIPPRPSPNITDDITPDALSKWLKRHEILMMWIIALVVATGSMPAIVLIAKAIMGDR